MDTLPDEIILHILSFLDVAELLLLQRVSRRSCVLSRDTKLWKIICFENSRAEASRRRQEQIATQATPIATLRDAIDSSLSKVLSWMRTGDNPHPHPQPLDPITARKRAFANWDPDYPTEPVNYYQEYIHRHAPISLRWLEPARDFVNGSEEERDSLGMGIITDGSDGVARKALSPLEDGSVCIWDVQYQSPSRGRIIARSKRSIIFRANNTHLSSESNLTPSPDSGTSETVSIDNVQDKAYVAFGNCLNVIDINTLQVVQSREFLSPISALSEAKYPTPLTVGTQKRLYMHDDRLNQQEPNGDSGARLELIGGLQARNGEPALTSSVPADLSQPGPLSILHVPHTQSNSIMVGGRFTHLLHYDRRFWPKPQDVFFSGARISSLACIQRPYIPRNLNLVRDPNASFAELNRAKHSFGLTLVAVGEYKGKGSIEMYGIPFSNDRASPPSSAPNLTSYAQANSYRNRQTASQSRLLSVAPHGTRLIFSDGDGNLKWLERDGSSLVRSFNINPHMASSSSPSNPHLQESGGIPFYPQEAKQQSIISEAANDNSDIVQKIIPMTSRGIASHSCSEIPDNYDLHQDDLLLCTGDGKVGLLGFGKQRSFLAENAGEDGKKFSEEQLEEMEKEKQYSLRMREALERQANETRFVRGLGLGSPPRNFGSL